MLVPTINEARRSHLQLSKIISRGNYSEIPISSN